MGTRVHIVGTGLIGTSAGIALSRAGYDVTLHDPSPTAAGLARDLGAGRLAPPVGSSDPVADVGAVPDVVVVAAPPDVAGSVVVESLRRWPSATVTDVASVKVAILDHVSGQLSDDLPALSRYVGSHPMAGRERSGTVSARGDLFDGRAWVVVPHPGSSPESVAMVTGVATATGATVRVMDAHAHDVAVAAVSHVPQVLSSLVAGQLRHVDQSALSLAGQGLRDVTRVAASDPGLWTQILAGNAGAVRTSLESVHAELGELIGALRSLESDRRDGALEVIARTIGDGNTGQLAIPGKHGAPPTAYTVVSVLVPDRPGMIGRLLTDVGEADINLEDLHLEHGLGQPFGIAELAVLPAAADPLRTALVAKDWQLHS